MQTAKRIQTILVLTPHRLLAHGIQSALRLYTSADVQITCDLVDPRRLRQHISFVSPDILLIDPILSGLTFRDEIIDDNTSPLIVAINSQNLPESLLIGYNLIVPPTIDPQQLWQSILTLYNTSTQDDNTDINIQKQLSQREREVVMWVARGLTNKEIADKLFLSPHTIITHRRNIASKLDIHSPSGLTIYALMNNLITMDEAKGL